MNRKLGMATGHFGLAARFPIADFAAEMLQRVGIYASVRRLPPADAIHYLHIGKTAGTTIMDAIDAINARERRLAIIRRTHQTRLAELPPRARYFFSIRNPVSRFVSGFYSRLNKNAPSMFSDWTEGEALVFGHYSDASQLAEDLFEPGVVGSRAIEAMCSLGHAPTQLSWFNEGGCFLTCREPLHIIRQEHFAEDFAVFLGKAGLECDLPAARSNEGPKPTPLTDKARAKLERWYAADMAFYEACEEWINGPS